MKRFWQLSPKSRPVGKQRKANSEGRKLRRRKGGKEIKNGRKREERKGKMTGKISALVRENKSDPKQERFSAQWVETL